MTNLPAERSDATLATLGGQASLFDDPRLILQWDDAFLRTVAANIGREGGSIIAQLRRAAGLVAWAAWFRFPEDTYREFAVGLAGSLGIEVETLRKWRRSIVVAEKLPIPGIAGQRAEAAAKGRKTAGQSSGAVRTSATAEPIPAASTEAPAKQSEGKNGTGSPPHSAPGDSAARPGSPSGPPSGGAGIQPAPHGSTEAPAASLPAPPGPPERPPSDRQLAARVYAAMREVDPTDAGPVTTPEEATFAAQWMHRMYDAWKAKHAPPAPAEKPQRRQGTISRPADRVPKPPVKVNGAPLAGSLTRRTVEPMFKK